MGCCWSSPDPPLSAFDPVIGLSDKLKAGGLQVQGSEISGNGSILGDSPVLQDKAYFEVTIVHPGTFAVGFATKETPLDGVISQVLLPPVISQVLHSPAVISPLTRQSSPVASQLRLLRCL